jgi:hypothetical protein
MDLAETVYLAQSELEGTDGPIVMERAEAIVLAVEKLRSRSIAARYMSITGRLRADVEKIGANIEGIGDGFRIGVPTHPLCLSGQLDDGRRALMKPRLRADFPDTLVVGH